MTSAQCHMMMMMMMKRMVMQQPTDLLGQKSSCFFFLKCLNYSDAFLNLDLIMADGSNFYSFLW